MRDGGKGDLKRPLVVTEEQFNNNWDAIFGKKNDELHNISIEWTESDPVVQDSGRADSQHVSQSE